MIQTLVILFILVNCSAFVSTNKAFCNIDASSLTSIFRIANHIYIVGGKQLSGETVVWLYDVISKRLIDKDFTTSQLFLNVFPVEIDKFDTGFGFNFKGCQSGKHCEDINRSLNKAIVIGRPNGKPVQMYWVYGCDENGHICRLLKFPALEHWHLDVDSYESDKHAMSSRFWVNGFDSNYSAIAFHRRSRRLYAFIRPNYFFSNHFDVKTGLWNWSPMRTDSVHREINIKGLFVIKDKLFYYRDDVIGMLTLNLPEDNAQPVQFDYLIKTWSLKEFFNCYNNSYLLEAEMTETAVSAPQSESDSQNDAHVFNCWPQLIQCALFLIHIRYKIFC